jgi:NAD(P)-dependent dehydrogenase (short-subunit alcohol dehydrogenase family)
MRIEEQVAIVTGGGSGLGEAVARELARLGGKVAVLDVNVANAQRVAADIGGVGLAADITDTASMNAALDAAEAALGSARIVMNIAGIGTAKRVVGKDGLPAPLEDFERVIRVNLIGTYNVVRLTAARIARLEPLADGERGVMLMTASVAAFDGQVPEAVQQSLAASIPFPPRLGRPDEFAALAAHIVSNVHLNGETIRLDGALRMAPR